MTNVSAPRCPSPGPSQRSISISRRTSGLLARALDATTTEEERRTAAVLAVRELERSGLLRGGVWTPDIQRREQELTEGLRNVLGMNDRMRGISESILKQNERLVAIVTAWRWLTLMALTLGWMLGHWVR